MNGICPPPSEKTQSNSFSKSSNYMKEVLEMEWPDVSDVPEEIEVTCLRYCERFIGSETS